MVTVKELLTSMIEKINSRIRSINGVTADEAGNIVLPNPDLSQNDPEAADYVKGRTHYTGDPVETTLIPEQTVTFTNQGDMCNAISPVNVDLVEGNTYTVIFDGETYECTCQLLGGAYLFIGSPKVFGEEDTGEPFIYASVNGVAYAWFAYDTETEHTLSLSTIEEEIIKLPSKYIDWDSSPFKRPILTMPAGDNLDEYLTDEQKQEYYDAWRSGSPIVYGNTGLIIGMYYSKTVGFNLVYISNAGTLYRYYSGKWHSFGLSQDSLEHLVNSQIGSRRAITLHSGVDEHSEYKSATLMWINGRPVIYKESLEPDGSIRIYNDHYLVQHGDKEIVLTSSTEGSTKKFRITVDDSGTLTVAEVV